MLALRSTSSKPLAGLGDAAGAGDRSGHNGPIGGGIGIVVDLNGAVCVVEVDGVLQVVVMAAVEELNLSVPKSLEPMSAELELQVSAPPGILTFMVPVPAEKPPPFESTGTCCRKCPDCG